MTWLLREAAVACVRVLVVTVVFRGEVFAGNVVSIVRGGHAVASHCGETVINVFFKVICVGAS